MIRPEPDGRLRSRVTGLLFGTGEDGWGLELWDAATGKRLTSAEDSAKARALRAANRADEAEERADKAERRNRELQAEIERLKARMKEHA